jgi:hypothetical protein
MARSNSREMSVELKAGIGPSDGIVPVDEPVVLGQLDPQGAARTEVGTPISPNDCHPATLPGR